MRNSTNRSRRTLRTPPLQGVSPAVTRAVAKVEQLEARRLMSVGGGFTAGGIVGQYFNNTSLNGSPSFTRRDVRIDFDWGTTIKPGGSISPGFRDIGADNYSVRWTGQVAPRFSETYTFRTTTDEGVRLFARPAGAPTWTTLIDAWTATTQADRTATYAMLSGQSYDIRMEYVETSGAALSRLRWSSPSTPQEVIDPAVETGINNPDLTAGLTDIIKGARNTWEGVDGLPAPTMDANGWPQGNGGYYFQESLNQGLDVDPMMRGRVAFSFNGSATVSIQGNVDSATLTSSYDSVNNVTTGSFTTRNNGWNASFIALRNTTRTGIPGGPGGVTNFRLMRPTAPDATTSYATTGTTTAPNAPVFTPQLIDAMSKFTIIRHQYVANQQRNWSDRTPPAFFNQSGGTRTNPYLGVGETSNNGMSWDYKVMLANETGSDLMISLPVPATTNPADTNSYVYKLAQLIRFGSDANGNPYTTATANPVYPPLNPNLRVVVELGNELWNFAGVFNVDFSNLNQLTAADASANNADFRAINYDGLTTALDANGTYVSINTWRLRKALLLTMQASDTFRAVWGDAAINDRVRAVYEFQYANDNDTARTPLVWAEKYFNNGDGINRVANPFPISRWLWGAGGATYYGANNGNGLTTLNPNAGFESTTVGNGLNQSPAGTGYTYTGPAGIARWTSGNTLGIPAPFDGAQMGYIQDNGSISINITFPSSFTSNVFAFAFKAHNRRKNGASQADVENLRVFLDDTTDITARTFSQGNGYTPPDVTQISPWLARNVFWTDSQYYYTKTFTVTPGQTRKITIRGSNAAGSDMMAFLEDLRVTSVDRIFQDGMPGGGEAAGQPTGQNIRNTMNTEVNWAQAFGLNTLAYEAGWSLGGDDGGSPLQLEAKYRDSRTAGVQGTFMDYFHQAGGAVNVHGTYAQWPSWSDFFAEQGLLNAGSYPIIQGMTDRAGKIKLETTNGVALPAVLTPSMSNISDNANAALGQINARGGWLNFNVLAPKTGSYSLSLASAGSGTLVLLADGAQVASGNAGTALTATVNFTAGLHSLRVRNTSANNLTISSLSVAGTGAPASPTLNSADDASAAATLAWSAVPGATGYIVRYGTTSGLYPTRLDVGNNLATTITGLVNGTQYFFAVDAYNASGESLPSNERGVIPFADGAQVTLATWEFSDINGTPTSPTSLVADASTSRLVFSNLTRGGGSTGLIPSNASWASSFRSGRFASESANAVYGSNLADAITRGQFYQFTVAPASGRDMSLSSLAFNAAFQNSRSTLGAGLQYSTNGTTFTTAADIALPNQASPGLRTVDLSTIPALQLITQTVTFRLYLYGIGAYEISGLGGGAQDLAGDLNLVGTTRTLAPNAPSNLIASSVAPTRVSLAWTDNSSNETGFKIERATNSTFTANLVQLATVAANTTTYNDNTTVGSTTYFYRVRASNASADSSPSNTATLTTPAPASTFAQDLFNGTVGTLHNVASGTGWSSNWSVQNNNTTSYSLATTPAMSYLTLDAGSSLARGGGAWLSSGRTLNTAGFTGYTRDASGNITGQASSGQGVLYFSSLLRNDSNTSADILVGLGNSGVNWISNSNIALQVGQFGGVRQWGLKNSAGTISRSSVASTTGATTLLVVKIDWTNNLASLFVNPTTLGGAVPSTASATIAIPAMNFRQFHFYGGNNTNDASLAAVRFGARYLDVTPTSSGQVLRPGNPGDNPAPPPLDMTLRRPLLPFSGVVVEPPLDFADSDVLPETRGLFA
jgi:hypothetical protein